MSQVGVNGVSNKSEFKGKIIKLGILCNTHTNIVRSLLFKYEGNINCKSRQNPFQFALFFSLNEISDFQT